MEYWWYLFFFVQGACAAGFYLNYKYSKHQQKLVDFITYQHKVIEDANDFILKVKKQDQELIDTVLFQHPKQDHSVN